MGCALTSVDDLLSRTPFDIAWIAGLPRWEVDKIQQLVEENHGIAEGGPEVSRRSVAKLLGTAKPHPKVWGFFFFFFFFPLPQWGKESQLGNKFLLAHNMQELLSGQGTRFRKVTRRRWCKGQPYPSLVRGHFASNGPSSSPTVTTLSSSLKFPQGFCF